MNNQKKQWQISSEKALEIASGGQRNVTADKAEVFSFLRLMEEGSIKKNLQDSERKSDNILKDTTNKNS